MVNKSLYLERVPAFCKWEGHRRMKCFGVISDFQGMSPEVYCRECPMARIKEEHKEPTQ